MGLHWRALCWRVLQSSRFSMLPVHLFLVGGGPVLNCSTAS